MRGIGGEQASTHAECLDAPRHGRKFLGCAADLLARQDQRRRAGEGDQHVRHRAVVNQMVEAALEGLAVQPNNTGFWCGCRLASPRPCWRKAASSAIGSSAWSKACTALSAGARRKVVPNAAFRRSLLRGDEDQDAAARGGAGQDSQHREQL